MNSQERVLAACRFETPDRIPRHEPFWNYTKEWEDRFGPLEDLMDTGVWAANESPFPSRARVIKEENGWIYQVDGWGQTTRHSPDAFFSETLEVAAPEGVDIDKIEFESPLLDSRYMIGLSAQEMAQAKERQCVFAKTGGPYLRTTLLRGQEQFLMDIAADPEFAYAIASKVADHLTVVGVEQISRWEMQETGIWIFDDFASSKGPMMSRKSFESIFLPIYKRMIKAYKDAGAKYVFLHCDGYPLPVFDMLIEAGFDGSHPIERRAGMDVVKIREMYPKFILIGGMDNIHTMVEGPVEKIRAEARELIDLGRQGGMIIGFHSIGPDVPMEHYAAYLDECLKYGDFS
jgi:uroporphyrinogen decarboxylase